MTNFTGKLTNSNSERLIHFISLCASLSSDHFYDIGCDHGEVGLSLIGHFKHVYLIDPSIDVINSLNTKVKDSDIPKHLFSIYHKKGENLKIQTQKNTFLIAGMGGKTTINILKNLIPQMKDHDFLVLSPHTDLFLVRRFLHESKLGTIKEELLFEKNIFYHVLILSLNSLIKTPLYENYQSSPHWDQYLDKQIKVYSSHRDKFSIDYLRYLESFRRN